MTPTATRKGSRLYRYYVSMDTIKNRDTSGADGSITTPRLPAAMVETAVVAQVQRMLQSPEISAQLIANVNQHEKHIDEQHIINALRQFDSLWDQLFPTEQARIIQLLVHRVTVTPAGLELDFHAAGMASLIRELLIPNTQEAAE